MWLGWYITVVLPTFLFYKKNYKCNIFNINSTDSIEKLLSRMCIDQLLKGSTPVMDTKFVLFKKCIPPLILNLDLEVKSKDVPVKAMKTWESEYYSTHF
jgi:hypothetical protein